MFRDVLRIEAAADALGPFFSSSKAFFFCVIPLVLLRAEIKAAVDALSPFCSSSKAAVAEVEAATEA